MKWNLVFFNNIRNEYRKNKQHKINTTISYLIIKLYLRCRSISILKMYLTQNKPKIYLISLLPDLDLPLLDELLRLLERDLPILNKNHFFFNRCMFFSQISQNQYICKCVKTLQLEDFAFWNSKIFCTDFIINYSF